MYLLIPEGTINRILDDDDLHPTMYLLIQRIINRYSNEGDNLHPTMYLLIHYRTRPRAGATLFTSHYVSINSCSVKLTFCCLNNLHPTMYLLILMLSLIKKLFR